MSDLVKVAIAALRKAEVEMRYAGWSVFQSDNIGRFDALKQVLDTIEYLEPFVIKPQGWYKSGESKDYDPKGLHITQTPVPQLATDCTRIMREQGKPYPRTCPRCGLGPCAYIPLTTVQKLSMNQDAAGLLHDKAHVATPSSHPEIPDNSQPVARVTGYYGGRCVIEPLDGKSIFPTGMAIYTHPAPLRDLSNEEIKDIELSLREYYDNDRYDLSLNKFARAIIDAALAAEPQQPVAWRDKSTTPGYPSYEYNRQGIGEPLYTKPVAAQYSDLVSDGGLDPRNASDVAAPQDQDAKDAARYRWMRDKSEPAYFVRVPYNLWDETIDAAMDAQIVKVMSENKWEDV